MLSLSHCYGAFHPIEPLGAARAAQTARMLDIGVYLELIS